MLAPQGIRVVLGLFSGIWLPMMQAAPATVKVAMPALSPGAASRLILHFDSLQLPPNSSGVVRVFADLPDADSNTKPEGEHFLGYFTVLPKNSVEAARGIQRNSATLDLSDKAKQLAGKKEVTLTIVPLGGTSAPSVRGEAPPQSKPKFGRVYVAKE